MSYASLSEGQIFKEIELSSKNIISMSRKTGLPTGYTNLYKFHQKTYFPTFSQILDIISLS
jgi:hypothetical protein